MNRYPSWLNILVVLVFITGFVFALPNVYNSLPSVQIANADGSKMDNEQIDEAIDLIHNLDINPVTKYIEDGRAVILFSDPKDQLISGDRLRGRYLDSKSVAYTLTPNLPNWLRSIGIKPMSLGLDLRGGVYFLLEVDMETAINTRLTLYQQSFNDLLRDSKIRSRIDINGSEVIVRVRNEPDLIRARNIVSEMDSDLLILDGSETSFRVRMTENQIKARQDFAIEQNITTLRNRVNQLGVAEPLVQRQGLDRIVVQLPGVQDPNRLDDILTATATLEFHLVDNGGNSPGSRRYSGRTGVPSQVLRREIIASGDQIIDAESGFSQGQPAVFITLDAAGGESMLKTTRENLNKPMSTVFIETRRVTDIQDGEPSTRVIKTEEIISTATIRGVFKDRFQITGLTPLEARELALLLRAGALAAPVFKIEERTIGPSLGQDNIDRGFNAVTIGFLAVVFFIYLVIFTMQLILNNIFLFKRLECPSTDVQSYVRQRNIGWPDPV